jgi:hypothetical protein
MYYRENTKSMSHYLDQEEITFGAAISLIRVFGSEEFKSLIESQKKEVYAEFSKGVLSGLNVRLNRNQYLATFVTFFALEAMNIARGYESGDSISELLNTYTELKGERTAEVLRNVIDFQDAIGKESTRSKGELIKEQITPMLFPNSITDSSLESKKFNLRLSKSQLLYFRLKKSIIKKALTIKIQVSRNHPWNF